MPARDIFEERHYRGRPAPPRTVLVMSHTDTQTAKIATLTFVTGVALGFVLNNRLRRWLNGY
mgnify:FL=1